MDKGELWGFFYGSDPDLMGITQRRDLCESVSQLLAWLKSADADFGRMVGITVLTVIQPLLAQQQTPKSEFSSLGQLVTALECIFTPVDATAGQGIF